MERQIIQQHIENYRAEVERAIYEPIVQRDVGLVSVDATKAFFLLLPMLNGERWTEHVNTAAIAVGAVHAGFDAHDAIDLFDATSTQQQLTVLSGDHFSGIHYRLLASLPEFGFIRSLSQSIGRVNEMKTTVHKQLPGEQSKLIEAIHTIEVGCIENFLHTFGFSRYVQLAKSALPLLWLEAQSTGSKVSAYERERAVTLLATQLQEAIDAAHFLHPILRQEIGKMTTPLLSKLM